MTVGMTVGARFARLPPVLRTPNHRIYAMRGLVGFTFLLTFFPGATLIPISDAQALLFTSPLFATVLAVIFLGERLRARRVGALAAGFAGALVILRPGIAEVSTGAILVLIAAMANATSNVIVRHTTRSDHPDMAVLYLMLYVTPLILGPALFVWKTPTPVQALLMIGVGVFATLNQRCLSRAFHAAEATAVLPFDFARLPFAAVIGGIAFAEFPDIWVWAGGAIIFSASIYLAHREAVARRSRRVDAENPAG
jgi:drug/metabolite transporter (DMT)-like permease